MKHKIGFNRLDRSAAHRKALHRSMVTALIKHERITTTKAKALEIKRTAEKLITRAKEDTVHNRRIVSRRLFDEGVASKLFTDVGIRMKDRPGGYTRIIKLGERLGDATEMVILELVDYKLKEKEEKSKEKGDKKVPASKKPKSEVEVKVDKKEGAKKRAPKPKAEKAEA